MRSIFKQSSINKYLSFFALLILMCMETNVVHAQISVPTTEDQLIQALDLKDPKNQFSKLSPANQLAALERMHTNWSEKPEASDPAQNAYALAVQSLATDFDKMDPNTRTQFQNFLKAIGLQSSLLNYNQQTYVRDTMLPEIEIEANELTENEAAQAQIAAQTAIQAQQMGASQALQQQTQAQPVTSQATTYTTMQPGFYVPRDQQATQATSSQMATGLSGAIGTAQQPLSSTHYQMLLNQAPTDPTQRAQYLQALNALQAGDPTLWTAYHMQQAPTDPTQRAKFIQALQALNAGDATQWMTYQQGYPSQATTGVPAQGQGPQGQGYVGGAPTFGQTFGQTGFYTAGGTSAFGQAGFGQTVAIQQTVQVSTATTVIPVINNVLLQANINERIKGLYSLIQQAEGKVFDADTQSAFATALVKVFNDAQTTAAYLSQMLDAAINTPLLNDAQQNYVENNMVKAPGRRIPALYHPGITVSAQAPQAGGTPQAAAGEVGAIPAPVIPVKLPPVPVAKGPKKAKKKKKGAKAAKKGLKKSKKKGLKKKGKAGALGGIPLATQKSKAKKQGKAAGKKKKKHKKGAKKFSIPQTTTPAATRTTDSTAAPVDQPQIPMA